MKRPYLLALASLVMNLLGSACSSDPAATGGSGAASTGGAG